MSSPYEKAKVNLKRIVYIRDLLIQGLAKKEDKDEAISLALETSKFFTNDILKRKVEKLSKQTVWTYETKSGFVKEDEHTEITQWVKLIEEYLDAQKITTNISNEKINVTSVVDGEDRHIFITEKGSKDHVHFIIDGGTGETRIDPKDQPPHELVHSVETRLTLKTGEVIKSTNGILNFVPPEGSMPEVKVYFSKKDNYPVLEIYNCGDEDLEDFVISVSWEGNEGFQKIDISQYYEETDYLVMALPKSLNLLRKGSRVFAQAPTGSINDMLKVEVKCNGLKSGLVFQKEYELRIKRDI